MATIDRHGRPRPPLAGDEISTLLGYLDYQRATLAWKCGGLDAEGLSKRLKPSTLTLGGLLKHMALVEESWFSVKLNNVDLQSPFDTIDWEEDPDWEFHSAGDDSPEELCALWEAAVERSRANVAAALRSGSLGQLAKRPRSSGQVPSLRWILLHMIEEYARHNGHADLLRENVDGQTGE